MSDDLVQIRLNHCMAWRLAQAIGMSFADAEVVIHEDGKASTVVMSWIWGAGKDHFT